MFTNNFFTKTELDELSAVKGGSFVNRMVKQKISDGSNVLFVGIGGLGCNTINELKGIYDKEYEHTNRIKFLAIDTDDDSLSRFNIHNGGYLIANEVFSVFSEESQSLLIQRPPVVKSWISEDVPRERLCPYYSPRRVYGRALLCGTNRYLELETKIHNIINELQHIGDGHVDVVLVSGLSGNTGGGMFIDIGYMIRILLDEKAAIEGLSCDYYGVFYTPDVQRNIPAVGGDLCTWNNLCRNGYAALKELDYFMNIGKQGQNKPVYSISLPGNIVRSSCNSLFDVNKVFIISATERSYECQEIVKSTAAGILNMFRPGVARTGNGQDTPITQSVLSDLFSLNSQISTWLITRVGAPAWEDFDPCGNKYTTFPAFMNYNYSSFGFREIYFPRNEMVAYCANKAFEQVCHIWQRAFEFNDHMILSVASKCHLDNLDHLFEDICSRLGVDDEKFMIKADEDSYPIRRGFPWMGSVVGSETTVAAAKSKVDAVLKALQIPDSMIQSFVDTLKAQTLDDKNFMLQYGPFGGLVLLKGSDRAKGIIERLEEFRSNLPLIINDKRIACDAAYKSMMKAKDIMDRNRAPHDDEIHTYVCHCNNYSNAYFEYGFFNHYMPVILGKIIYKLNDFSNETFDIYVPIVNTIRGILNEDSERFSRFTLERRYSANAYSFNAFDLDDALSRNNLFKDIFDGYIDDQKVKQVAMSFASSLSNQDSREKWRNYTFDPVALADEIRRLFGDIIYPIVNGMLEKFMVVIYGDRNAIINCVEAVDRITFDDVNRIWENDDLRINALRTAARNIVDSLSYSSMVALKLCAFDLANLSDHISVILLAETPNLNQFIIDELLARYGHHFSYSVVGGDVCDHKTSITLISRIGPIALPHVKGMRDYAAEYFRSEKSMSVFAGCHLDEVTERWQDNLPEIFGLDTEEYFVETRGMPMMTIQDYDRVVDKNGNVKNVDKIRYEEIKRDVDYGLKHGYIYLDNDNRFVMVVLTDKSNAFVKKLKDKIVNMRNHTDQPDTNWFDVLKAVCKEDNCDYYKLVYLDESLNNGPLTARQSVFPAYDSFVLNIYRIVRYNMRMAKTVAENRKFFESTQIFCD
ncbi:MAG: hypothetical protein IJ275_01505 [Ruminococcus sp.]|nr:hypothetical protein [Ruminococcus sp.]